MDDGSNRSHRWWAKRTLKNEDITASDIEGFEKRYRTSLINSLSGIRTAFVGITADDRGRFNAATLSNITRIGANPAQMSILFRPDNGKRHTLSNYRNEGKITLVCMPLSKSATVHEVSMNAPEGIFELEIVGENYKERQNWPHPLNVIPICHRARIH